MSNGRDYDDKSLASRRAVLQQLALLQQAGVTMLPKASEVSMARLVEIGLAEADIEKVETSAAGQGAATVTVTSGIETTGVGRQPAEEHGEGNENEGVTVAKRDGQVEKGGEAAIGQLRALAAELSGCTLCHELSSTRTQTVFGVGSAAARLCFMGEAPGADEDKQGEPFVGRAGKLLNKIIEACGLSREEVYILNTLKCRPPGNRNPTPEEAANCRPFFDRQLDLVRPEFICCLGAIAAHSLLQTTTPIGKLRGKVHEYRGYKVICTYHPAYLLRNPSQKRATWEDMQFLLRELGLPIPEGGGS